jgi:hypothetical protein
VPISQGELSAMSSQKKRMDAPESKVHSFIVKLWLEDAVDETELAGWRGYVTHVPSGKRCYLQTLDDILGFVKPYVPEVEGTRDPRDRRWLKLWGRKKR